MGYGKDSQKDVPITPNPLLSKIIHFPEYPPYRTKDKDR